MDDRVLKEADCMTAHVGGLNGAVSVCCNDISAPLPPLPPAETLAVELGDGERCAVRPRELHLRGAEQAWHHQPDLPAGCSG